MALKDLYSILKRIADAAEKGDKEKAHDINTEEFVPRYDELFPGAYASGSLAHRYDLARNGFMNYLTAESRQDKDALLKKARKLFKALPKS